MAIGRKTGGGSRKGIPNRVKAELAIAQAESGLSPADFLLSVLRDTEHPMPLRIDAAKAVAPYVHPRLAQIEHSGKDGGPVPVQLIGSDGSL